MTFIAFILNLPWTIIGLILAFLSRPYKMTFDPKTLTFIFKVRSLWWYTWLPGKKKVRALANGHIIQLGPLEQEKDLAHELVHVEQSIREPFIKPFLYLIETLKHGYHSNKYEKEAYKRAGNTYEY